MLVQLALALAAVAQQSPPPPAAASAMVEVAVLSRTIERGESLSAGDFATEQRPANSARGAIAGADADGLEAKRRLMAGAVVREGDLARAQAVRRGEAVTIALHAGGLSISTAGRALTGGGIGDPVRVVSLATNRTLDGMVEGTGMVRLLGR